jgi:hypothetical protein
MNASGFKSNAVLVVWEVVFLLRIDGEVFGESNVSVISDVTTVSIGTEQMYQATSRNRARLERRRYDDGVMVPAGMLEVKIK